MAGGECAAGHFQLAKRVAYAAASRAEFRADRAGHQQFPWASRRERGQWAGRSEARTRPVWEPARACFCTDRPQPGLRTARAGGHRDPAVDGLPLLLHSIVKLAAGQCDDDPLYFCRRRKPDRGPHCRRQIPECAVDNALLHGGQPHAGVGPGDDYGAGSEQDNPGGWASSARCSCCRWWRRRRRRR